MFKVKNNYVKLICFLVFFSVLSYLPIEVSFAESQSGAELWSQNCGRCHNFRGVNEFDDAQWSIIMGHMRAVGNIPGDQARAILSFLQASNNPAVEIKDGKPTTKISSIKGDAANGRQVYVSNCTSCHGMSGKGNGPAAASLSPKPRDLSDQAYMSKISDANIYKAINEGGSAVNKSPLMPAWGNILSDQEIRDIVSYIKTLK